MLRLRQFYAYFSTICKRHKISGRHTIACSLVIGLTCNIPTVEAQETSTTAPPTEKPAVSKAEDLVLQIVIDGTVMEEFIQGVQKNGQLYLPLGEISMALDFPITVNADEISADGWFINEKNHISINKNSVSLKGEKSEFPSESMIVKDQDIYVESTLLQTWFSMNFSLSRENMTLDISTRETLPHMEALMRKKLQAKLASQKKSSRRHRI